MAQAARLNLRMQKEFKLLLTDPPPSVSFPSLSDAHSSLTSIDALLRGPEGSVYSNGVFKIKIQIPERYPFQPPIVTFATPIYHPNIDNGGRICLDILNLPPKGMWQPSLNISTVLTSIGLLLSEPNPDDGLMHEASRDYKYNRQAFNQNARSMTEKYAKAGVSDIARVENGSQIPTGQSTSKTETEGSAASVCISGHGKLSLEPPGCSNNGMYNGEETSKAPVHNISKSPVDIGPVKEASKDSSKYSWNFGKLRATRYKLSPKVPVASHDRNGESESTSVSNQYSSVLGIQTTEFPESMQVCNMSSIRDEGLADKNHSTSVNKVLQSIQHVRTDPRRDPDKKSQSVPQCTVSRLGSVTKRPQKGSSLSLNSNHNVTNPPNVALAGKRNCPTSNRLKKGDLLKPSSETLGHPQCLLTKLTKETTASVIISPSIPESDMFNRREKVVTTAPKLSETAVKLPLESLNQLPGSNDDVILRPINDGRSSRKQRVIEVCDGESANTIKKLGEETQATDVVVLDSEESDDENVPVRSKLSLTRRCWSRKRKLGL